MYAKSISKGTELLLIPVPKLYGADLFFTLALSGTFEDPAGPPLPEAGSPAVFSSFPANTLQWEGRALGFWIVKFMRN